jgi:hypothetical protein
MGKAPVGNAVKDFRSGKHAFFEELGGTGGLPASVFTRPKGSLADKLPVPPDMLCTTWQPLKIVHGVAR